MLKVPAKNTPPKPRLEILYRKQVRRSYQFAKAFEQYEFNIMFNNKQRGYDELIEMVRTHIKQRRINKNIADMKDGGKPGYVARSRSGSRSQSAPRRQGEC